jgi:hypothetical protein
MPQNPHYDHLPALPPIPWRPYPAVPPRLGLALLA